MLGLWFLHYLLCIYIISIIYWWTICMDWKYSFLRPEISRSEIVRNIFGGIGVVCIVFIIYFLLGQNNLFEGAKTWQQDTRTEVSNMWSDDESLQYSAPDYDEIIDKSVKERKKIHMDISMWDDLFELHIPFAGVTLRLQNNQLVAGSVSFLWDDIQFIDVEESYKDQIYSHLIDDLILTNQYPSTNLRILEIKKIANEDVVIAELHIWSMTKKIQMDITKQSEHWYLLKYTIDFRNRFPNTKVPKIFQNVTTRREI